MISEIVVSTFFIVSGIFFGIYLLTLLIVSYFFSSKLPLDSKILMFATPIDFFSFLLVAFFALYYGAIFWPITIIILIIHTALMGSLYYILLKPLRSFTEQTQNFNSQTQFSLPIIRESAELMEASENLIEFQESYNDLSKKLGNIDRYYSKFLPAEYLQFLNKKGFADLKVGDSIQMRSTVLFCDVRDSLFSSETIDLSANFDIIQSFLKKVSKIIRESNGFVDKFLGDGILAIFENEVEAIKCANKITRSINRDDKLKIGEEKIKFGIALHTGDVIVGVVGEDKRCSVTVVSDTVNITARIESLNKVFSSNVLFTKQTLNGIKEKLNYRYIGSIQTKEILEPIPLFESIDCYTGKQRESNLATKSMFETAVRLYEKNQYEKAKEMFEKSFKKNQADNISKYYIEQINLAGY